MPTQSQPSSARRKARRRRRVSLFVRIALSLYTPALFCAPRKPPITSCANYYRPLSLPLSPFQAHFLDGASRAAFTIVSSLFFHVDPPLSIASSHRTAKEKVEIPSSQISGISPPFLIKCSEKVSPPSSFSSASSAGRRRQMMRSLAQKGKKRGRRAEGGGRIEGLGAPTHSPTWGGGKSWGYRRKKK